MIARALLIAAALFAAAAARAEDASPEMLAAALQAMQAQRDQALNREVGLSAQLSLAQREIARLRQEAARAKSGPAPAPPETK